MKTFIVVIVLFATCFSGCKENPVQPSGPSVEIISPTANLSNYDSVYVTLKASDDKKVVRLELFIDHELAKVFTGEPYAYTWYTTYLADGSQHVLEARAYDEDGNDATSKPVIIYTYRFRPSNLTASFQSDTTVHLSWTDNSTVETGFEIEKRINSGEFTLVKTVTANVVTAVVQCDNAFTDSVYFRVRAVTGNEKSEYSNMTMAHRTLTSPSDIQLTFESDTTLRVTWKDNTAFESGYRIQVNSLAVVEVPANSTGALLPVHLENGAFYTVVVTAFRGNNTGLGIWGTAKQFIVPNPVDLTMSSQGLNQLTVSWKDTCSYEKGFIIERADASRIFSIIGRTGLNVLQFTDPNVDSSKQYSYRVIAETKYTASFPSRELSVGYQPGLALIKSIILPLGKRSILLSKDQKKAITAEFNSRTMTIWNTESMTEETNIIYEDSTAQGPQCAALHPNGKTVAVGFYYKYVVIFDAETGSRIATIDQASRMGVKGLRYNSDGTKLVTCGSGLNVWQDNTYAKLGVMVNTRPMYWLDYSPSGDVVIANPGDGSGVNMYDMNSFASIRQLQTSNDATDCAFSTDGSLIVGRTGIGIVVWNSRTGSIVNQLPGAWNISAVRMNSNTDIVFTSSVDKFGISIWSLKTNKLIATVNKNLAETEQIQLSADGHYLYSAGWNAVQKWEIRNEWKVVM